MNEPQRKTFIQFIHVNYNCLNFYSCLLNQKQNVLWCDVTWLCFMLFRLLASFPEFPGALHTFACSLVIREPSTPKEHKNNIQSFCFVCLKILFILEFLIAFSLFPRHENKYFKYFFYSLVYFYSSTYLKLSESIIFSMNEQWEGKNLNL